MGLCSSLVACISHQTEYPISPVIGYFFSVTSVCHTLSEPSHYFERFLHSHNAPASWSPSIDRPLASPQATHSHEQATLPSQPLVNDPIHASAAELREKRRGYLAENEHGMSIVCQK